MGYEISVSDHKTYLHIRVNKPVTFELLERFIRETADKANIYKINNFLFDLRQAPNQTSMINHYDMIYEQSKKFGFKPSSKHALIISREDKRDYSFVETVLINAGYKSRMFLDELSAIEWLES